MKQPDCGKCSYVLIDDIPGRYGPLGTLKVNPECPVHAKLLTERVKCTSEPATGSLETPIEGDEVEF